MKLARRILLSLGIAAFLLALLLAWSDARLSDVLAALGALEPSAFWGSLAILAGIYGLRALRFRALIAPGRRPGAGRILAVTAAHGLAAYVLPAKIGEASLVLYLRRTCGVGALDGLAVLVVARLLDLAAVAGALALACLLLAAGGAYPQLAWLAPLGLALTATAVVFAWLGARGGRLVGLVGRSLGALRLDRTRLGARAAALAARLAQALSLVGGGRLGLGAAISPLIWLGVFVYYALLARGLGLDAVSFGEAVFASSLAVLSNLLPVNGFAGFGTQEAGWTAGYGALGVPARLAMESALAFHLVYLAHIVLFGLLGHVAMGLAPAKAPPPEGEDRERARLALERAPSADLAGRLDARPVDSGAAESADR